MSDSSDSFDRIFDVSCDIQDVYDEFGQPIVLSGMDGVKGTLFAYGQTSSGKTYTMMGDQQNEGVIPEAVGEIFDYVEKELNDLLNPSKTNLKVRGSPPNQIYIEDLKEEVVTSEEEVLNHLLCGEKKRHFGETKMNIRSSRSHTIFTVGSFLPCLKPWLNIFVLHVVCRAKRLVAQQKTDILVRLS